ncbi:low molecular weight protein-tyrosine-phosphatase [Reinekea sp.]|jgi:protein-tyrosine phosphatase|uniref:low molecular weight protein-tyrosine-phosphatase n=1 Tax=Reinekea sp. TaxID=1970455 RepID=UPI00398A458C
MKKLLFVCLGNICRSPTAHGMMAHENEQRNLGLLIDSAGTANYHIGKLPDSRTLAAALNRGLDFSDQRARQVSIEDFYNFDYIFAMDRNNLADLKAMQPSDSIAQLELYLEFAGLAVPEVPDPYYGAGDGFEKVLDLCVQATKNIASKIAHD